MNSQHDNLAPGRTEQAQQAPAQNSQTILEGIRASHQTLAYMLRNWTEAEPDTSATSEDSIMVQGTPEDMSSSQANPEGSHGTQPNSEEASASQPSSEDIQMIQILLNKFGLDHLTSLVQQQSGSNSPPIDPRIGSSSNIQGSSAEGAANGSLPAATPGSLPAAGASLAKRTRTADQAGLSRAVAGTNGQRRKIQRTDQGYECVLCLEAQIQVSCGRKNDIKRHMEDFHCLDKQWTCPLADCGQTFDLEKSFKQHCKKDLHHREGKIQSRKCMTVLCKQTQFACGFPDCGFHVTGPFSESHSETRKAYFGHIISHFDEGCAAGTWSYSQRVRTMLCQMTTQGAGLNISPSTSWDFKTTNVLRRCLETAHIMDPEATVQYAMALVPSTGAAGNPTHMPLVLPVWEQCECSKGVNGAPTASGQNQWDSSMLQQMSSDINTSLPFDSTALLTLPTDPQPPSQAQQDGNGDYFPKKTGPYTANANPGLFHTPTQSANLDVFAFADLNGFSAPFDFNQFTQ